MGGPLFREALHASTAHIGALLAERNASTPTHQQQSLPSLPTQEVCASHRSELAPSPSLSLSLSFALAVRLKTTVAPPKQEPQARSIEEEDMRVAEDTETGDAEESSAKRRKGGISSWRASGAVRLPPGSLHLAHEGCVYVRTFWCACVCVCLAASLLMVQSAKHFSLRVKINEVSNELS